MPGLLLLILYRETAELRYKRAAEKIRRAFDTHPRTSDGGFWHVTGERWWRLWAYNKTDGKLWADGAFMVVPFLVEYGLTFPDTGASADEAVHQLLVYARHLQDPPPACSTTSMTRPVGRPGWRRGPSIPASSGAGRSAGTVWP